MCGDGRAWESAPVPNGTLDKIRKVLDDPHCDRLHRGSLLGFLGELYVKTRLIEEGVDVLHHGKHGGYDLEVDIEGRPLLLDVKTSSFKDEQSQGQFHWGWGLASERDPTCTHFVCLGLDCAYRPKVLFVIRGESVGEFPPGFGQFRSYSHCFTFFPKNPRGNPGQRWYQQYQRCHLLLGDNSVSRVRSNGRLASVLATP